MRFMAATALISSFVLVFPAVAQTRLPRNSPAERRVEDINRNLQQEQRQLRLEQQYQIDSNRTRQNIDRQRMFSNPPPAGRIGTCPPSSIGC